VNGVSWALAALWTVYAETRLLHSQLHRSWVASVWKVLVALTVALGIFIALEFTVITVFQGLAVWR